MRKALHAWVKDNRWLLLVGGVTICVVVAWYLNLSLAAQLAAPEQHALDHPGPKLMTILYACLVGWFLDIFTGCATKKKVDQMVAFCYIFPFAIFAGILLPLSAYPVALPDPPKPIGVLLGCNVRPTATNDRNLIPEGIRCRHLTDQWLVNIGGNAVPLPSSLSAEEILREEEKADPAPDPGANGARAPIGGSSRPPALPDGAGTGDAQRFFVVTGGLVVPLYFVMLAIFGAFVSMLRRVPEYQERASAGANDPLSWERAREKLVFEVLQLLAAPLIAITAYYLIDPGSRASSIALAFIAGFSSETVLLYVRALTEKLQPQTDRREVTVEVVPTALEFGSQAVGTESAPQTIRLANRAATPLHGSATLSGEFGCIDTGAFVLPSRSGMIFRVTFKPTSPGHKAGQLEIRDDGPGSPRVLLLTGEGADDA
jgi:hypothetical protein